jgi:hypothetical protein
VRTHRWLATGEANAIDKKMLNTNASKPFDFFEGEHIAPVEPHHALRRHAVGTTKVAAVGD